MSKLPCSGVFGRKLTDNVWGKEGFWSSIFAISSTFFWWIWVEVQKASWDETQKNPGSIFSEADGGKA